MLLTDRIQHACARLRDGSIRSEQAVSQSVVLPILDALGWPRSDPRFVVPEYSVGSGRVDFALLTHGRATVFVEVKQPGMAGHADRQLFQYAYHEGVQIAVLTDGKTWHGYGPGLGGSYDERKVVLIDLLNEDAQDSAERLRRYLDRDAVDSEQAEENVRVDYKHLREQRIARAELGKAWATLVADPRLASLLSAGVESVCGFQPDAADLAAFLVSLQPEKSFPPPSRTMIRVSPLPLDPPPTDPPTQLSSVGFELAGSFTAGKNPVDVTAQVFRALSARDADFLDRFADLPKHGKTRRYVARDPLLLYPDRPDLARSSVEIVPGYWLATNNSSHRKARILKMAADVAGLEFGLDLKVRLT